MTTPTLPPVTADQPAYDASVKQKSQAKTSRIPIKVVAAEVLKKPDWIRVKAGSPSTRFYEIKNILREHRLHTVCNFCSRRICLISVKRELGLAAFTRIQSGLLSASFGTILIGILAVFA